MMLRIVWVLVFVCGLTFETGQPSFAAADVGQPAPDLVVKQLDGKLFDLKALHGKVVVINFWATWCPPCRQEMQALNATYERFRHKKFAMVALSTDKLRHGDDVEYIMKAYTYPAAMRDKATTNDFDDPKTLPTTYVIDTSGVIVARLEFDPAQPGTQMLDAVLTRLLPDKASGR